MILKTFKLILLITIGTVATGCTTTAKQPYLLDTNVISHISSSELKILINTEVQKEFIPIHTPEVVGAGSLFQLADEGQNSAVQRANREQLLPLITEIDDEQVAAEIGLSLIESLSQLDWLHLSSAQITHYNNAKEIVESEEVEINQEPDLTLYATYHITLNSNFKSLSVVCELSALPNNPKLYEFAQDYSTNKPNSKNNSLYLNTLRTTIALPNSLIENSQKKGKSKQRQEYLIERLSQDNALLLQELLTTASVDLASQAQQNLSKTVTRS